MRIILIMSDRCGTRGSGVIRDANEPDSMRIVVYPNSAHLYFMYIQIRLLSEQIVEKYV